MKLYKQVLKEHLMGDEDRVKIVMNVAAGVIMRYDDNNNKQILLIQRSKNDHWPNHWEFPRGKCDKPIGESLIHCCAREIKEETGLDVEPLNIIDTYEYMADRGTRKSICHNFLCRMKDPEQKVKLSKEHQDHMWVSELGQVELIALPDQKRTIEKVLNTDRPIVSNPENNFTKNNTQVEVQDMSITEKYLQNLQEKYKRKLPRGLKTHDGEVDEVLLKKLMLIAKNIRMFMKTQFRMLKPKYYVDDTIKRRRYDLSYDDWHEPGALMVNNMFHMEWNLWGRKDNNAGSDESIAACDELNDIVQKLFIAIMKRFQFKPGFDMSEVDDNIIFLKNGKILMSMGAEGDKCEDIGFWLNIYGSNVDKYGGIPLSKFGIR